MDPDAMAPLGLALTAYERGESAAELVVRREDGLETPLPVSHFFRDPSEFSAIELAAVERCRGHVLDIGAGTGLHGLALLVLRERAGAAGWESEVVVEEETGDYLARLTRRRHADDLKEM